MQNRFLGWLMAAVFYMTCQPAIAQEILVKPDASFQAIAFSNTSKLGMAIYAGVREIDGRVAVCGLVFFGEKISNSLRQGEPQITRKLKYILGGVRLHPQTSQFKRYKTEAEGLAGKAGCSVTNEPWQKAFAKTLLKMETVGGASYNDG